ncbi:MAG: hypothetical protein ACI4MG_09920 [Aristaeellaceae bacterium]
MKQRILICLSMVLVLTAFLCGAALAENNQLSVAMSLSKDRFTGPQEVTVTITVTNNSSTDMPGPVGLYDPNGNPLEAFGTPRLAAGESKSWQGTWMVTEEQLTLGRITYGISYYVEDNAGVLIQKQSTFSSSIVRAGETPELRITRTISPTTARNGQKVYVIYEITNVGGVDVSNVVIKESSAISATNAKIAQIKAGEKASHTFTVTMNKKNLSSNATITYEANGKSYSEKVDEATIKYGDVQLKATLKADKKGGNAGETVKLTLTLENTGKKAIQNVSVTDPLLGQVFSGLTVEAGKSLKQEKELTITQSCDLLFTVSGSTAAGDTVETATEIVSIIAVDPSSEVALAVNATVDTNTIYTDSVNRDGVVTFTVTVTNTGSVEAKNVTVTASGVTMASYDSIPAGKAVTFKRDALISTAGKYRFDASTANQLGQTVTFPGNEVQIGFARPTAVPPLEPIATPVRPQTEPDATLDDVPADWQDAVQPVIDIAKWVLLALGAACLVLVIVGIAGRSANAAHSGSAADHLERDGYSDYMQAVPAKKRRILPDNEAEAEDSPADTESGMAVEPTDIPAPAAEETGASEPDMQDAMNELYPDAAEPETTSAETPDAAQNPGEGATYRRRRRTSADE